MPVFDGEREVGTVPTQVQVRVAPRMELGRSAQRLPSAQAAAAFFGMMHEEDCEIVASLQFSQIGQERRDLAAGVLVDPVQPHERGQDQKPVRKFRDGLLETSAICGKIEPQRRCGDDVNIEFAKADAGGGADALKTVAYDVQS